jgi:hypothetical protein
VATDYDAPRVRPEDEPVDAALSALQFGPAKPSRDGRWTRRATPPPAWTCPGRT